MSAHLHTHTPIHHSFTRPPPPPRVLYYYSVCARTSEITCVRRRNAGQPLSMRGFSYLLGAPEGVRAVAGPRCRPGTSRRQSVPRRRPGNSTATSTRPRVPLCVHVPAVFLRHYVVPRPRQILTAGRCRCDFFIYPGRPRHTYYT